MKNYLRSAMLIVAIAATTTSGLALAPTGGNPRPQQLTVSVVLDLALSVLGL
jgi:hypothetical protein